MFDVTNAVKYHYDNFPPKNLNYSLFLDELLRATEAIARFDQMLKNIHNNEILLAPLRNQEAVISSRIEWTISTMDEILEYESEWEENYARDDVVETFLYQKTLKNSQQSIKNGYEISQSLIKQMHQQLLSFGRWAEKSPWSFKIEQNYLADSRQNIKFVPISPEKLSEWLDKLFSFINTKDTPVLVKTAILHLEFEALHPFKDWNWRIGRMLIPLFLWKEWILSEPHFYISGFFEEFKDEYIDIMRNVSISNTWEEWIKFFLKAVEVQAIKNLEIANQIHELYESMKEEFWEVLASKWTIVVMDFIFTYPVFRANKLAQKTDIPEWTASWIIKKLYKKNIIQLKEKWSWSRASLYSFEKLMKIVRI